MGSDGVTCNSSNDLLGSILLNINNTFSKCSQQNMPKAKPQNTQIPKCRDPLGLETDSTEYLKMVAKLIREDDPIQNNTFNVIRD